MRFGVAFRGGFWYNACVCEVAGRPQVLYALEESPSTTGQGAGEMPAEATLGKVQQRDTAKSRPVRDRKDGKVR